MKDCQSLINLSTDERKSFFCLDTSGNRSKFSYMEKHYPSILNEIEIYAKQYNLDHLPFKEQCYLFAYDIKKAPINDKLKGSCFMIGIHCLISCLTPRPQ